MKKFIYNFLIVLPLSLIFSGILLYLLAYENRDENYSVSPLPSFLTLSQNSQVTLLDLWAPKVDIAEGSQFDLDDLTAKSVIMYDLSTNRTLYERNSTTRYPVASLTKIMTAIIALENRKDDDKYIVEKENLVGENTMGLSKGEILSFMDLLHGLLLPSGNDAAEVLAGNHPTGRDGFIKDMNLKAGSLGLSNTQFVNPSGLQGDGEQYSTAYDMLVITRYAIDNFPEFRKAVSSAEYSVRQTPFHKSYELYNETNLLTTYEGVRGVKTGYTPEAGLCLVTYLDYKGHRMVGVILNSENRRLEMKNLLDYSLESLGINPPKYKG